MPGSQGMAQMIQMLTALSEIQTRRQQLDLMRDQFDETKSQFAQKLGFDERSERYKMFTSLMDKASNASGPGQKEALSELAQSLYPNDPNMVASLTKYGANAPMSLEMLRTQAANAGSQPGASQTQQEAYAGAVSGMNRGQVAQSGMMGMLGQGAQQFMQQNPGAATQMAQGYAQRGATGQTQLGAAQDQSILADPNAVGKSAAIGAGLAPSSFQAASLEADYAKLIATLNSSKALGALTNEQRISAIAKKAEIQSKMNDRQTSDADRVRYGSYLNEINKILGEGSVYSSPEDTNKGRGITGSWFDSPVPPPSSFNSNPIQGMTAPGRMLPYPIPFNR